MDDFYTEDLTLDYQTLSIKGKTAVLDYFKDYFNGVKEKLTPLQIFIDGDNIAVEISDELTAKVDIPDLMGTPVKELNLTEGKGVVTEVARQGSREDAAQLSRVKEN